MLMEVLWYASQDQRNLGGIKNVRLNLAVLEYLLLTHSSFAWTIRVLAITRVYALKEKDQWVLKKNKYRTRR